MICRAILSSVLTLLVSSSLGAQSSDTAVHWSRKSPTAAALWSTVLPGAGQIYVGQTLIGFTLMGLTIGSFGAMLAPREVTGRDCVSTGVYGTVNYTTTCKDVLASWSKNRGFGYAAAAAWAVSIVSAPLLARDYNRRHGIIATVSPAANGATRLGVAMRF